MRIVPPETLLGATVLDVHLLNGRPIQAGLGIIALQAATEQMAWIPACP